MINYPAGTKYVGRMTNGDVTYFFDKDMVELGYETYPGKVVLISRDWHDSFLDRLILTEIF